MMLGSAIGGIVHGHASSNTPRFYTEASFLYWKSQVNGLAFALESDPSFGRGKICNPSVRWGPGFRVELGYKIPHDEWKIALQFTSCRNHCTTTTLVPEGLVLFPVWTSPFQQTLETFRQIQQHYRLHLGLVDLLLSKQLLASARIDLTPYVGLCFGSVRQKYHLDYGGSIMWRMKNKFEGLGPTMGCTGRVFLFKGFSLSAGAFVRLLYGEFYTHQGERLVPSQVKNVGLFNRFFSVEPVAAGAVCLSWQSRQWKVEAGYDQMLFFAQNQLPHFISSSSPGMIASNQGDLSLLGVHLTGAVIF